jgi:predicted nucleic acid-binding protein
VKIVVDTNIVISSLINRSGKEYNLIMNPSYNLSIHTCYFLYSELLKHKRKILNLSKLREQEFLELFGLVSKNINFIDEDQIPAGLWQTAYNLTKPVDENDTPFVALTMYLGGVLWTGDKKLHRGLVRRDYHNIITTQQLLILGTTSLNR